MIGSGSVRRCSFRPIGGQNRFAIGAWQQILGSIGILVGEGEVFRFSPQFCVYIYIYIVFIPEDHELVPISKTEFVFILSLRL